MAEENSVSELHRPPLADPAYSDRLLLAIGHVAASSAQLEDLLPEMLADFVGHLWAGVLWERQSTEWLLRSASRLLSETDPYNREYAAGQHKGFYALVAQGRRLSGLRNFVVHGWFRRNGVLEDDLISRPWGNWDSETPLFCMPSRTGSLLQEQMFAVTDVERLADELSDLAVRWAALWQEMRGGWVLRRWNVEPAEGDA